MPAAVRPPGPSRARGGLGMGNLVRSWWRTRGPRGASAAESRSLVERFLFRPARYPDGDWHPPALDFVDVFFRASDGTPLHGWWCPALRPRAVVLVCHGNGGHVAFRQAWLAALQTVLRVSVFAFDYRGYGRSGGVPTVRGVLDDAAAARCVAADRGGVEVERVVLMGESLGGAVAVRLAVATAPRGLVLQSTFTRVRDVARMHFPLLGRLVPGDLLDSERALARLACPLLVSHGDADRLIPFSHARALFAAAGNASQPRALVRVRGADHDDWITPTYLDALDSFLDRLP